MKYVTFGSETLSHLALKTWELFPAEIKKVKLVACFKRAIKKWKPITPFVIYARHLFFRLVSYNLFYDTSQTSLTFFSFPFLFIILVFVFFCNIGKLTLISQCVWSFLCIYVYQGFGILEETFGVKRSKTACQLQNFSYIFGAKEWRGAWQDKQIFMVMRGDTTSQSPSLMETLYTVIL